MGVQMKHKFFNQLLVAKSGSTMSLHNFLKFDWSVQGFAFLLSKNSSIDVHFYFPKTLQ